MGKTIQKKLIIIILILCVTSGLAHVRRDTGAIGIQNRTLKEAFSTIDGYSMSGHLKMEQNIFDSLDLDDYTYTVYERDNINITLYIGYYFTADKVSSAHSPLVCFPAQGWMLEKSISRSVSFGDSTVNYAEMEATLGKTKQLILYWFQTDQHTTPHSHVEKVYALYNRLVKNEGQNAFVRISIPLENTNREDALAAGDEFIRSFYPKFIQYIEGKD